MHPGRMHKDSVGTWEVALLMQGCRELQTSSVCLPPAGPSGLSIELPA